MGICPIWQVGVRIHMVCQKLKRTATRLQFVLNLKTVRIKHNFAKRIYHSMIYGVAFLQHTQELIYINLVIKQKTR